MLPWNMVLLLYNTLGSFSQVFQNSSKVTECFSGGEAPFGVKNEVHKADCSGK